MNGHKRWEKGYRRDLREAWKVDLQGDIPRPSLNVHNIDYDDPLLFSRSFGLTNGACKRHATAITDLPAFPPIPSNRSKERQTRAVDAVVKGNSGRTQIQISGCRFIIFGDGVRKRPSVYHWGNTSAPPSFSSSTLVTPAST